MLTYSTPRFGTDLARFDRGALLNTFHRFMGPSAPQQKGTPVQCWVIQDGPAERFARLGSCNTFIL
jgi:hypothetical protein